MATKTEVIASISAHIKDAPGKEAEALLQATLTEPFLTLRKYILAARERKDQSCEDILIALGTVYSRLNSRMR